jgi:hypothetical protein
MPIKRYKPEQIVTMLRQIGAANATPYRIEKAKTTFAIRTPFDGLCPPPNAMEGLSVSTI